MSTGPLDRLADVTPFHMRVTARAGLSECDRNQHLCLPSGKSISDVIPKHLNGISPQPWGLILVLLGLIILCVSV